MEIGEEYDGRVVSIQAFGAFIELIPGKDGLLHISRVAQGRVEKVEDVLSVGDTVKVKVLDIDDRGKVSLDRLDKPEAPAGSGGGSSEGGDRAPRRDDRGGDPVAPAAEIAVRGAGSRREPALDRTRRPRSIDGAWPPFGFVRPCWDSGKHRGRHCPDASLPVSWEVPRDPTGQVARPTARQSEIPPLQPAYRAGICDVGQALHLLSPAPPPRRHG